MSKKLSKEEKKNKKKVKPGRLAKREALTGLLFVSPWIVGAVLFLAYPLITSFWYALNNIRITPLGKNFTFLGYGNFTQILLSDADFPTQLIDYLVSTIISVPVIVVFALIIAMMLNENIKAKGFFRLIFFLPVIIVSGPILGMLNQQGAGSITAIDTQAISSAITTFLPSAIGEPIAEIFENMVTILWYSGVQILIFLSGLQKIDRSMYEAAKIDGCGAFKTFVRVMVPLAKPTFVVVTMLCIIWHWNDYYLAVMYLSDNFPLAVKIYDIDTLLNAYNIWQGSSASIAAKSACCFIFITPMLILYLVLQRKFVQSIDRVGITG